MYLRTTGISAAGPAKIQVILHLPVHFLIGSKKYFLLTDTILHQLEYNSQVGPFQQDQFQDRSLSHSNRQRVCTPTGPHRTKYWRSQDIDHKQDTQGLSKNICLESET